MKAADDEDTGVVDGAEDQGMTIAYCVFCCGVLCECPCCGHPTCLDCGGGCFCGELGGDDIDTSERKESDED